MARRPGIQKWLARELGLSPQRVSTLVRAGMPTTLAGAREWRAERLDAHRMQVQAALHAKSRAPNPPALVAELATAALDDPASLECLRAAFVALSVEDAELVRLPEAVWYALTTLPDGTNALAMPKINGSA